MPIAVMIRSPSAIRFDSVVRMALGKPVDPDVSFSSAACAYVAGSAFCLFTRRSGPCGSATANAPNRAPKSATSVSVALASIGISGVRSERHASSNGMAAERLPAAETTSCPGRIPSAESCLCNCRWDCHTCDALSTSLDAGA
jgi:hypothetical protein